MRISCCLIFLLTVSVIGWGQTSLPDSIAKRFEHLPVDSNLVIRLNRLSTNYLKTNPALARKIATHSADVAKDIHFNRGYARSLTVIGNSYWYEGIYEFAQNYYMLAARYYQASRDSVGLGYTFNNIGEVNKKLGDYDMALTYLKLSVDLRKTDTTLALSMINIAELYTMQKKYSEAAEYAKKAQVIATKNSDLRSMNYFYWINAKIILARKTFEEALPWFEKAIKGWQKIGEIRNLVQTYHDLADAYRDRHDIAKAEFYLDLVEKTERRISAPDLKVRTYLLRAKLDSTRGNFSGAYANLRRHNSLKDSIYNISKVEQIARVQAIYENERNERENEQLRADRELKNQQLRNRESILLAISLGLFIVVALATVLFRQRRRIMKSNAILQFKNDEIKSQKESIELQAHTLMRLNEELNKANKTLEGRIDERSKQLVIQSQKLAEYSFVNAHKLRAPVASILGLIQLLDRASPEEKDVILKHLKTCGNQLDTVIQEISKTLGPD